MKMEDEVNAMGKSTIGAIVNRNAGK